MDSTNLQEDLDTSITDVEIRQSPLSKQGNLTGTPRKVRDNVAEIHYLVQKWNSALIESFEIVERILLMKHERKKMNAGAMLYTSDPQEIYFEKQNNLSRELEEVVKKLTSTVQEMGKIVGSFAALVRLETLRHNESTPIFLTWPIEQYETVSEELHKAYEKELSSKMAVRKNILAQMDDTSLQALAALWRVHCFLSTREDFLLESMLKETGHR